MKNILLLLGILSIGSAVFAAGDNVSTTCEANAGERVVLLKHGESYVTSFQGRMVNVMNCVSPDLSFNGATKETMIAGACLHKMDNDGQNILFYCSK